MKDNYIRLHTRMLKVVDFIYNEQLSIRKVAKEFNVSRQTIWNDIFIRYYNYINEELVGEDQENAYDILFSIKKLMDKNRSPNFKRGYKR